jgi:hypothetical protein
MRDTWALNLFPRLRYRLRTGRWCQHVEWGPWLTVDLGRRQIRWCTECGFPDMR